jgi:hypothetical protein
MAHKQNKSRDYITHGVKQFDTDYQLGKQITMEDLKHLPAKYGGHISVIPYYYTEENATFLLTLNHWKNKKKGESGTVLGCIGGGVKNDVTPYTGLLYELDQEVPAYKNKLLEYIESPKAEILALENKAGSREWLRYYIFIFVPIEKAYAMHIKDTFRRVVNHNKPDEQKELGAILFFNAFPETSTDITFGMIMHRNDLSSGLQGYHSYGQHNKSSVLYNLTRKIQSLHPFIRDQIYTVMKTSFYFPPSMIATLLDICLQSDAADEIIERTGEPPHLSLEELVQKHTTPITVASKPASKPSAANAHSSTSSTSSTSTTSSTSAHSTTRNASPKKNSVSNHNNGSWTQVKGKPKKTKKQKKPTKKNTKKKGTRKI